MNVNSITVVTMTQEQFAYRAQWPNSPIGILSLFVMLTRTGQTATPILIIEVSFGEVVKKVGICLRRTSYNAAAICPDDISRHVYVPASSCLVLLIVRSNWPRCAPLNTLNLAANWLDTTLPLNTVYVTFVLLFRSFRSHCTAPLESVLQTRVVDVPGMAVTSDGLTVKVATADPINAVKQYRDSNSSFQHRRKASRIYCDGL